MANFKINPLVNSSTRIQEAIQEVEKQLNTPKLSPTQKKKLCVELDSYANDLQELRKNSLLVDEFAQEQIAVNLMGLERKIVSLYGRIQTLSINYEIADVLHQTQILEEALKGASQNRVTDAKSSLEKKVDKVVFDNALPKRDRRLINLARIALKRADSFLNNKPVTFLSQKPINSEKKIDFDLVVALFDIAYQFYLYEIEAATLALAHLDDEVQKQVEEHLKIIGPEKSPLCLVQALIATAHVTANMESEEIYLSEEEVERLFAELQQIKEEH